MSVRAAIFDLDDTLYDCSGLLVEAARRRAARAMVRAGLPLSEEAAYQKQLEIAERFGPRVNAFDKIAQTYGMGDELVKAALEGYNSDEVLDIRPFPDVVPTLSRLREASIMTFLVTRGVHGRQERKIDMLGLRPYFDEIIISDEERGPTQEECYLDIMRSYSLHPSEVISVGDRIHSEITISNRLGMITVQMRHGRFKDLRPRSGLEDPHFEIDRLSELVDYIKFINRSKRGPDPKVVAVGGGTGLPILLEGIKSYTRDLTAVVAVTDAGRSSGKIRADFGLPPPGDIRNCLVALAESEELVHKLFQYRFENGSLEGMTMGNLFIAALAKVTGSFEEALKETSRILAIRGKVLPSTTADAQICAELNDGQIIEGELNVRKLNKPPIKRVFLSLADAPASEEAIEEIVKADYVILGPGSLYTSVISNLLVEGIAGAVRLSKATTVYVCNIVTQPGQTDGYSASDHVKAIIEQIGAEALDYVLVNNKVPPPEVLEAYARAGAELVKVDEDLHRLGVQVVEADLLEKLEGGSRRVLWEKQDLLRHDPAKLARIIIGLNSTAA